jgi:uncharacterized protein (DUF1330 family)
MAACVIVDIDIADPTRYEEYKRLAGPTVTAHGGRYVARGGKVTALDGDWRPGRVVVLEFPSAEKAKRGGIRPTTGARARSATSARGRA